MSDTSEDGGEVATNLVISEFSRSTNHHNHHQHHHNHQFRNNTNNNSSRNNITTTTTNSSNNNHIHNNLSSNHESQIPVHHLPVGKVIDNMGSLPSSSSSSTSNNHRSATMESVLDLRTTTTTSTTATVTGIVATEVIVAADSSGSETEERVPSIEMAEVELHEVVAQASAVLNDSTSPASNSSEIAIDTDTDDDVILVAPPMEVIEVQDEDDEDVQIVSQGHVAIPKPLASSSMSSSHNHGNGPTSKKSRLLPAPPTLPDIAEIDEIPDDNNIPVLLGDLFDSHFGHFDFDLPAIELPPSHSAIIPSTSNGLHPNNSLAESITNMKRNVEIAIQTEATYEEIGTQTDEIKEPPKKRKWSYTEEDDGDGTACPICYEPWEESGEHRLVSLKCGHLFGESCLTQWFNQQNQAKNRMFCPVCRTKAMQHHIRPIFARRVVQIKYEKINELRAEVTKWKRSYHALQSQCNRLQQTAAVAAAAQIPMHAHHPAQLPQTSAQVASSPFLVHQTSGVHSTTAQPTPISSTIERPRIISIGNVYSPDYRLQVGRFLPPNYVQAPPHFGIENEFHI